jgi:hypothetical protein
MDINVSEEPVIVVFKVAYYSRRGANDTDMWMRGPEFFFRSELSFIISLMRVSFFYPEDGGSKFF